MRLVTFGLLLLCAAPLAGQQTERLADDRPAGAALRAAVVETRYTLRGLGLEVVDRRAVLPDGRVERSTSLPDGTPVDLDRLRREDHALGLAQRGNMTPALLERVEALAEHESLEVAFWLREPAGDGGAGLRTANLGHTRRSRDEALASDVRAERSAAHAAAHQRYAPGNTAFASRVEAAGAGLVLVADVWPFVIAAVDRDQARLLALDLAVDEAYLSQPTWIEEGEFAQGTLRQPVVWEQGLTAGSSVNILVNDTAQVQTTNAYLPPVIELNNSGTGSHATGVAGNIANAHPVHMAANHGIHQIYSAGGSGDSAAPPIWSDAIAMGIDYGNCSWWNGLKGSIAFLDRFFDHTIRNFGVMMFKSTGNQGTSGTPYTTTPGNGFNMTNSGAYSDGNDVVWAGDSMASSSSYWDPAEGHEKPEVASPGTGVTTTGTGSSGLQTGFTGTSSASPLTCGVAGLISAGDTSLLAQMTTVKAVLMASAWHNVEGDELLSEFDGAGGVHAAAAWATVRDQQWWHDEVVDSDFQGGVLDVPMPALAGDDMRVVALWFSNPNAAYTTDVLDMDVDMTILDPAMAVVASSASAANPFEIASFRASTSGTYTVRLSRQRFDGSSEPLSVVWSSRSDSASASVSVLGAGDPFARGKTPTMVFSEPYEGAGRTYVAWASLVGPDGTVFGDNGYTLPAGLGFFSNYSVFLPGFVGTLDANGRAAALLPLPDVPQAANLPLHFGLVILGPSGLLDDVTAVAYDSVFVIAP